MIQVKANSYQLRIKMQLDRAKEIIEALADGVDPYTGEQFPADGPYQRADNHEIEMVCHREPSSMR